jgi:tryptophanyl-tRNA synthetase
MFSGLQPTGLLHVGNYIGALSFWVERQADYESIFCIADLHALTNPEAVRPDELRRQVPETAALLLACGIDPARSRLFVQSHIPEHAELAWLLNCVTPVGWVRRMTQFKAKAAERAAATMGLLDYPVLQAADVLLYQAAVVPVGEDQRQHIELTRDIARRFHALYGQAFTLPEALVRERGARIMGLDDPTVKMSKSLAVSRPGHAIGLTDSPDAIRTAVMGAVTDSGQSLLFDGISPGLENLVTIYEALSGSARAAVEREFTGKGYGVLKRAVADLIIAATDPIRRRFAELVADNAELDRVLRAGAADVRPIAAATLARVKAAMGISPGRPSGFDQ